MNHLDCLSLGRPSPSCQIVVASVLPDVLLGQGRGLDDLVQRHPLRQLQDGRVREQISLPVGGGGSGGVGEGEGETVNALLP